MYVHQLVFVNYYSDMMRS